MIDFLGLCTGLVAGGAAGFIAGRLLRLAGYDKGYEDWVEGRRRPRPGEVDEH